VLLVPSTIDMLTPTPPTDAGAAGRVAFSGRRAPRAATLMTGLPWRRTPSPSLPGSPSPEGRWDAALHTSTRACVCLGVASELRAAGRSSSRALQQRWALPAGPCATRRVAQERRARPLAPQRGTGSYLM